MDSKTLIKALKTAVRQVIKEELTEILRDGLQDTINNPDEAMKITTKYVEGLKADDPIQKKVLLATIDNMKALNGAKMGESSAQAWETTQNTLLAMGQIKQKLDVKDYFTNAFLP